MSLDINKYCEEEKNETRKSFNIPLNLTIILIVVILAGAYIFVEIYKTEKQQIKEKEQLQWVEKQTEKAKQEEEDQRKKLEMCLDELQLNYANEWNKYCEYRKQNKDCALPSNIARSLERKYDDVRDNCNRRFNSKSFDTSDIDHEENMFNN